MRRESGFHLMGGKFLVVFPIPEVPNPPLQEDLGLAFAGVKYYNGTGQYTAS